MGKRSSKKLRKCDPVPPGTVLTDSQNVQWKVGPLIGSGGFGDIYCACGTTEPVPAQAENYPFVVKIEPHENGPLFVEKNFYLKHCQEAALERYRKQRKLKHLGVARYISSGSQELLGVKYRYLVMPRFGDSLQTLLVRHTECLPRHIVFRVAIQMLDVLEFVHTTCGYVHGDLKAANILLALGEADQGRVYLIDYGMAARVVVDRQPVPDLRKKHNGTLEFCPRDAHQGVPTCRGDLESLAYNLIDWTGGMLPWKLVQDCTKVQQMKEASFMQDVALKLISVPSSEHIAISSPPAGTPRKRRKIDDLPKATPTRRSTRLQDQSRTSSLN